MVLSELSVIAARKGALKLRQVESFYFGRDEQLFGMYHPATGNPRRHGIVICPPLFHEYYRSHFTIKRIAVELAAKGFDVLRFDYSGTGDSKGNIPTRLFEAWSRDIGDAITEVGHLGSYKDISIVTARFSASLALPWKQVIRKYVCWDPIFDCNQYLERIEKINNRTLGEHLSMSRGEIEAHAENDFLGTGVTRKALEKCLVQFTNRLADEELSSLSNDTVEVRSDTDWEVAGTEMIYAHDVIGRVAAAV